VVLEKGNIKKGARTAKVQGDYVMPVPPQKEGRTPILVLSHHKGVLPDPDGEKKRRFGKVYATSGNE